MKFLLVVLGLFACCSSCYQVHADDDLRTVPVTNNPHIVPVTDPLSRLMAMP